MMTPVSRRVMNLSHFLTQARRRYGKEIGLVWGQDTWTWGELDTRVNALCAELAARGVRKSDRVLVQLRNCNQLFETMFACFRLGAVWVPTNFRQTPDEVAFLAESSGASAMICGRDFPDHASRCGIRETIMVGDDGAAGYEALIRSRIATGDADKIVAASVEYDDACWFFYTSGTTGRPKAAVLTHGQMAFVITNHLADLMPGITATDASLVVAPLTHGAGIHLLTQVARGAKSIMPAGYKFDPADAWDLVQRWRVSNLFTVPTIVKMLVEDPSVDRFDHSSLRYLIYAGAPMYREDQKYALKKLGPVLVQYFGLGEVTGNITVLRAEDHDATDSPTVKVGTCGRERTAMQVSIQDDAGQMLPSGMNGEICVCGPAVFAGYFNNPEANAKAFRNGWFRTGDIGYLDEQGDLFITGRASDMYISGGSNVYPREVEEQLLAHGLINEAAVVGVPDPKWGEVGVAFCVLEAGGTLDEAELLTWLRGRVASYKMPKTVVFRDSLPRSGYGKVSKAALKSILTGVAER